MVLKLYLQLGLKLTKIHCVIQYKQNDFLQPFIAFNTMKRNIAKDSNDEVGKDLYKLMNNSIYGKTLENIRKHSNSKFVFDRNEMRKVVNGRFFKNFIVISEDCLLVNCYKKTITLNKPIFLGM